MVLSEIRPHSIRKYWKHILKIQNMWIHEKPSKPNKNILYSHLVDKPVFISHLYDSAGVNGRKLSIFLLFFWKTAEKKFRSFSKSLFLRFPSFPKTAEQFLLFSQKGGFKKKLSAVHTCTIVHLCIGLRSEWTNSHQTESFRNANLMPHFVRSKRVFSSQKTSLKHQSLVLEIWLRVLISR